MNEINKGTRTWSEYLILQLVEPECREPGLKEIKDIIQKLKNHKAPEEGNINSEIFKMAVEGIVKLMRSLIRDIWRNEQIPNNWILPNF